MRSLLVRSKQPGLFLLFLLIIIKLYLFTNVRNNDSLPMKILRKKLLCSALD